MADPIVPAGQAPAGTPAPAAAPSPVPAKPAQATPQLAAPAVTPQPAAPVPAATVPLPALQEERAKRQALEAEVESLRQRVAVNAQPQQQVPQQQQHIDTKAELERLWDTDPRKAVQFEILTAMDWHDRTNANLDLQADNLALRYPDFNHYRSSALSYVRSLPINQRGNPGVLETAYYITRGQNVDSLLQQRETELLDKYRRGEFNAAQQAVPAGSFSAPSMTSGVTLSADQIKVAEMMGLSAEGYASQIKLAPPTGPR